MKEKLLAWVLCAAVFGVVRSTAITVGPFGAKGEGGAKNNQSFLIGQGGSVYELDGFVFVAGQDLNGGLLGTTAQLSRDSLPAGLVYQFSFALSADQSDLALIYTFSNTSSNALNGMRFFALLDAEIDQTKNTFFNEFGTVQGTPGPGGGDPAPNQWQIDEPGFQTGALLRNLFLGTLNNSNSIPQTALNDVAMSLGFDLGTLLPGDSSSVRVMVSEAQHLLGSFALIQHDSDPASTTVITLSGMVGPGSVAQLTGTVFKDANTNGVPDAGEPLAGVTVMLLSNQVSVAQATTDAQGSYTINSKPGNYTVKVDAATLPAGLTMVAVQGGATNTPWPVTLASDFPKTVNWGYRPAVVGAITGTAFKDANTNGVADVGEGLSGVVLLLQSNQVTVAQTTTEAGGKYGFTNAPGGYTLILVTNSLPVGLTLIAVQGGATNNPWSVTLPANGVSLVNWAFQRPGGSEFENVIGLVGYGFLKWELNRARGTLVGTLSITNLPASGVSIGPPYQLGMHVSPNFFYPTNFGVAVGSLENGVPFVELTAAVTARVAQGVLNPAQGIVLTNVVEIYSLTRSAPPQSLFELWATRQ